MKRVLAVAFFCLPAFGQATYSGLGLHSGSATYFTSSSGSCAAPHSCAYNGVDLIQWGTVPNVGGTTNNGATVYDTSYINGCPGNPGGHCINWDGTAFTNAALLNPVTRITDSHSAGNTTDVFTAGQGGSGVVTLTNIDTSLVGITDSGIEYICRFATSGANKGHCSTGSWYGTYQPTGLFISQGQKTGGSCVSNCAPTDFGSVVFDHVISNVVYTFGVSTEYANPTAVYPTTIVPSTGQYTIATAPIVDFQFGLPLGTSYSSGVSAANAPYWTASTSYSYGAYITHALTAAEMATSGVWTSGHTYAAGDIVTAQGGTIQCMYRVTTGGTSSGSSPAFVNTPPCKTDTLTDSGGVKWKGTNSTAQFVYQDIASGTHTSSGSTFQWVATPATLATDGTMSAGSAVLTSASNPFTAGMVGQTVSVAAAGNAGGTTPLDTTILSYQNSGQVSLATPTVQTGGTSAAAIGLTGHPDTFSLTVGDANGIIWENVGTSYVPTNGNQLWHTVAGVSKDSTYSAGGGTYPSKYGMGISTNSYSNAPKYSFTAGQDTGFWQMEYDATLNIYHLLNTATGIWTDYSCSGGSGYNCSGGTWTPTVVGTLKAITDPLSTGQACPFYVHDLKMNTNGLFEQNVTAVNAPYPACAPILNFMLWKTTTSSFDPWASLQVTDGGLAHWAIDANTVITENNSQWGYTNGIFLGVYNANNVQGNSGNPPQGSGNPPPFSVYLKPLANQSAAQTTPPGCYVTVGSTTKNPDCNLSEVIGSHLSRAGGPGTDTYPACGTTYNLATLSPIAFNAWQNEETCFQTSPTYPTGYSIPNSGSPGSVPTLPLSQSFGNVWRLTHTFATGTSVTFSTQFQISEYSQDANWMFFSSDWNCQLGSTLAGNAVPTVWSSGTYYQYLILTPVPASPNSLCGLPWQAVNSYGAGNLINPIEGTGGSAQVDDVFQALTAGTSGPASTLLTGNPKCGTTSCFSQTNPPTVTPISVTAATESGTTATVTVSTAMPLNAGVFVTLEGMTPSGYNGTWSANASSGTAVTLAGLPSGLGSATGFGTATAQGDTVCDNQNYNGTTQVNSLNPLVPYLTSCPNGVVWQDLGPQTQRGDVFCGEPWAQLKSHENLRAFHIGGTVFLRSSGATRPQ